MHYEKTIQFASGAGSITIQIDVDFTHISRLDHALLATVIALIRDYETEAMSRPPAVAKLAD